MPHSPGRETHLARVCSYALTNTGVRKQKCAHTRAWVCIFLASVCMSAMRACLRARRGKAKRQEDENHNPAPHDYLPARGSTTRTILWVPLPHRSYRRHRCAHIDQPTNHPQTSKHTPISTRTKPDPIYTMPAHGTPPKNKKKTPAPIADY